MTSTGEVGVDPVLFHSNLRKSFFVFAGLSDRINTKSFVPDLQKAISSRVQPQHAFGAGQV